MLMLVQRRENADLQNSRFIYNHGGGVPLMSSQLPVMPCCDRNRSSCTFVEAQPVDHVMEEPRKMTSAFLEVQPDSGELRLFLHKPHPIVNRRVELPFENVCHGLCARRYRKGPIAAHR